MGPPLVDEDWQAICKAIEGEEWTRSKYIEIHWSNIRHPSSSCKAKTLRTISEAKANREAYNDQGSKRQI